MDRSQSPENLPHRRAFVLFLVLKIMYDQGRGFLDTAYQRAEYLDCLAAEPHTKDEIESALGDSRSTVDRAIRELEHWELVHRTVDTYELTLAGVLVLDEIHRLRSRFRSLSKSAPALRAMPTTAGLVGSVFEAATVTLPGDDVVRGPVDEHSRLLDRATSVRTIGSVVLPQLIETYHRRIVTDGMTADVVVSAPVVERLVSGYPDRVVEGLRTNRCQIRQISHEYSFGSVIANTPAGPRLGVLLYGDTEIIGFIETSAAPAIRWAESRFDRVWAAATPIGETISQ